MIAGAVLTLLLCSAAVAYVVLPLIRDDGTATERSTSALSEERELQSRQQMLLAALKDLEDDRATDKIGEADFEQLKNRLSTQAIEVMRRLDAVEQQRKQAEEEARKAAEPLRYPGKNR